MGNPGVYGQRRYVGSVVSADIVDNTIDDADIATTAIGTNELESEAVTAAKIATTCITGALMATTAIGPAECNTKVKRRQMIVQLGAGGSTIYIGKPNTAIDLKKLTIVGSVNAATTGTTAGITCTLKYAVASGATTATVAGAALDATTTAGSGVESWDTAALTATVAATEKLYLVTGATTKIDDNACCIIEYEPVD